MDRHITLYSQDKCMIYIIYIQILNHYYYISDLWYLSLGTAYAPASWLNLWLKGLYFLHCSCGFSCSWKHLLWLRGFMQDVSQHLMQQLSRSLHLLIFSMLHHHSYNSHHSLLSLLLHHHPYSSDTPSSPEQPSPSAVFGATPSSLQQPPPPAVTSATQSSLQQPSPSAVISAMSPSLQQQSSSSAVISATSSTLQPPSPSDKRICTPRQPFGHICRKGSIQFNSKNFNYPTRGNFVAIIFAVNVLWLEWTCDECLHHICSKCLWLEWMCDECTWHNKTFLVQSVYWHLAIKLYCIIVL